MVERVRAVLVTPANKILLIRRKRPGTPAYRVLPGGHVDPEDASLEDALRREVAEELAGTPEIHSLIEVVETATERQHIFLGRIAAWSFADRNGPEFAEDGRGTYDLEAMPTTAEAIAAASLKPDAVAHHLIDALRGGVDLFSLPDLRTAAAR